MIGLVNFDFAVVKANGCIKVFAFVPSILKGPVAFMLKVRSVLVLFVKEINLIFSG